MSFRLPDFSVGLGHRHRSVTVFPLFAPAASSAVAYRLAADALSSGAAKVEEVSARGEVGRVRVVNGAPEPILFLEGEQLVGAKQDRILNTTTMLPPGSRTEVPVCCVERGRWRPESDRFAPASSMAPAGLRRVVKASVTRSAVACAGFAADQAGVWSFIERGERRLGGGSPTQALRDLYCTSGQRLQGFTSTLGYVQGATGVAMGVGPRVVSIDLFDKPATCRRFWERLLSGAALDALQGDDQLGCVDAREVKGLVREAFSSRWVRIDAVGMGEEHRSRETEGFAASALSVAGTFVHFSIVQGR